jgi:hypothetical protein
VAGECCFTFPAGDVDAFEKRVREMVAQVRTRGPELRTLAIAEAERNFGVEKIGQDLIDHLRHVAAGARSKDASVEPQLDVAVAG